MSATVDMAEIEAAIDAESADWLEEANRALYDAIVTGVRRGATPAQIRRFVMYRCGREALALRCEQAARHIVRSAG
jgi:hypothetical protein